MSKEKTHKEHQDHHLNEHNHASDQHHSQGHTKHDHTEHHKAMIKDFKKRFWISLAATIPVLALSPMIQEFFNYSLSFKGVMYVLFGLSTGVYLYGGWPFLTGTIKELKKASPGMMTLIGVAITVAFIYSGAVVFGLEGKMFFWELVTLIDIMLIGHWIEMKSVLGAGKALQTLAKLIPDTAIVIRDGKEETVKVSEISKGDIVVVKPGSKIPVDGEIVEGETEVNESMLTGESKPVKKSKGDDVKGGSVNGEGSLKVKVTSVGDDTFLSQVIEMVRNAQSQKSKTQKLADKAAFWLTIIALLAGTGTFLGWWLMGEEFAFALERMVTVMVICCPHALGLAIPLVAAISTSVSANNGLLIRNRTAFENARKITMIVFDKTGTLTKGSHAVVEVKSLDDNYSEGDIIEITAAVEKPSEHHISKGILTKAKEMEIDVPEVSDFNYNSGVGVSGNVNGKKVQSGGFVLLKKLELDAPVTSDRPETIVFTVIEGTVIGYIALADEIRESSKEAIETLQKNNIKVSLLTGDNEKVAEAVAKELGMDDFMAEVLPDEKQDKIKELQDKGEFVAMTGDGVNDAPALAQADIGIAIGSGTDVAAESADIILVDSDPKDISSLILFGKATYSKMIQNLVWATGYNVIALPLATGFIPGLMISPALGAVLMSASTVICAVNAQLLRYKIS